MSRFESGQETFIVFDEALFSQSWPSPKIVGATCHRKIKSSKISRFRQFYYRRSLILTSKAPGILHDPVVPSLYIPGHAELDCVLDES